MLTKELTYKQLIIALFSPFGVSRQCFAIGKIALGEIVC